MPLFVCEKCSSIEELELVAVGPAVKPGTPLLCSACLPTEAKDGLKAGTGQWHGFFPRRQFDPNNDIVVNRPNGLSVGGY